MEINHRESPRHVRCVLFDFGGIISTLRCGREEVMDSMMTETLMACGRDSQELTASLIHAYIDESAGVQTIFQMKWLAGQVALRSGEPKDPWVYKGTYNRRLMLRVAEKIKECENGRTDADQCLIKGAVPFLKAL